MSSFGERRLFSFKWKTLGMKHWGWSFSPNFTQCLSKDVEWDGAWCHGRNETAHDVTSGHNKPTSIIRVTPENSTSVIMTRLFTCDGASNCPTTQTTFFKRLCPSSLVTVTEQVVFRIIFLSLYPKLWLYWATVSGFVLGGVTCSFVFEPSWSLRSAERCVCDANWNVLTFSK